MFRSKSMALSDLAVTAAGGRTWHFRYYWAGKQKRTAVRLADENTFEAVYRKWLKGWDSR